MDHPLDNLQKEAYYFNMKGGNSSYFEHPKEVIDHAWKLVKEYNKHQAEQFRPMLTDEEVPESDGDTGSNKALPPG